MSWHVWILQAKGFQAIQWGGWPHLSTALANNFLPPSVHSSSMFKDSHTGSETQYQSAGTTLSPPALKNGLLRKIMVSILSDIKLSSVLDICQYQVIKNDW